MCHLYRVFNKEGQKVKTYYTTKKMLFMVHKKVHTHPNSLTFDNLNQGSQMFHFKTYETPIFV